MNSFGKKFAFGTALAMALYAIITLIISEGQGGVEFWLSFSFMLIAFVCVGGMGLLISNKIRSLKDWIFSLPVIRWCIIYLGCELALSFIFMILPLGWKLTFITQLLLLVAFSGLVFPSMFQRDYVEKVREETKVKVAFTRTLLAKVTSLSARAEDAALKAALTEASETLRHSDPMSHEELGELEAEISALVDLLESQVKGADTEGAKASCKELGFKLTERSQMARALKLSQY